MKENQGNLVLVQTKTRDQNEANTHPIFLIDSLNLYFLTNIEYFGGIRSEKSLVTLTR